VTRREHIEQLAAEIGATIVYDAARYQQAADTVDRVLHLAPWPGEAHTLTPWSVLSGAAFGDHDVPEEELYWVTLHEMGHLETTPVPGPLRVESTFEYEARAWAWALEHSRFPLDQAGQSSIAWGLADYGNGRGLDPVASEALREIVAALGPEPDWFQNVTTEAHWRKLEEWGRPTWAKIVALVEAAEAVTT
jgi:hypothetical protein